MFLFDVGFLDQLFASFSTDAGRAAWTIYIGGMVFGAILVMLYYMTWGNMYMKCYMKNVMARGKKLFGVLVEEMEGYSQTKIVDFKPDKIDGRYFKGEGRIIHIRYWMATVPFAVANYEQSILLPLKQNIKTIDDKGNPMTVTVSSLERIEQDIIAFHIQKLKSQMNSLLIKMIIAVIILVFASIVIGLLNYNAANSAAASTDWVAKYISAHAPAGAGLPTVH
jgi:hypothetical protein